MTDVEIRPCHEPDTRTRYIAEGPIDFEIWLRRSLCSDKAEADTELVRGVIIDRMSAQYPHEWIFAWLLRLMGNFVEHRKLGIVLGSRTAVRISANDGRLPDILFVRATNTDIIKKNAIYGAPDLVVEIISENDRPYDIIQLETDYQAAGVIEILFIDPKRRRVRLLQQTETGYVETILTEGRLELAALPGFHIDEIDWLFNDDRPDAIALTLQLISEVDSQ